MPTVVYSSRERFWLWTIAVFGLVVVNGAFFYGLFQGDTLREALTNPISLGFLIEAGLLLCLLAYLLGKWGVARLNWRWFVLLSFLGSMAFGLPAVLLWGSRGSKEGEHD